MKLKQGPFWIFWTLMVVLGALPWVGQSQEMTCQKSSDEDSDFEPEVLGALPNPDIEKVLRDKKLTPSPHCFHSRDLNFGILVNNPYFKIYRSSGLGERGLRELENHLDGKEHPERLPSTIIYMNHYAYGKKSENITNYLVRKFKKMDHAPLYPYFPFALEQERLKQFPESQKTFEFFHPAGSQEGNVFLHGKNPLTDLLKDKDFSGKSIDPDLQNLSITTRGGRDSLYNVIEKILTGQGPVLFHCKGGIHRTGMTALMVRYLQGGSWTEPFEGEESGNFSVRPKIKAKSYHWVNLDNPAQYEYYLHNPKNFRRENLEAIEALSRDSRFQCLREKFQKYLNQGDADYGKKCQLDKDKEKDKDKDQSSFPGENFYEGLILPSQFSSYAKRSVEECRETYGLETEIQVNLDYLEAFLRKGHHKIRIRDGKLTSVHKSDPEEIRLEETARKIQSIKNKIIEYGQGLHKYSKVSQMKKRSEERLLDFDLRYAKILKKIKDNDFRLRAHLNEE